MNRDESKHILYDTVYTLNVYIINKYMVCILYSDIDICLFYLVLVLFDKFLLYLVTDQQIIFLVPDSCWVTVRNGNSISADFSEDTIKKPIRRMLVFAHFRQFSSCFGSFFRHCRINTIYTQCRNNKIHLRSLCF